LADIKNMLPDSTPLISANVLNASALKTAQPPPDNAAVRTFQAQVTASQPTDDGWTLTLRSGDKTLQVKSEYPLPENTRVQLAMTTDQGKVQLQVKAIILPDNEAAAVKTDTAAVLLKPVVQQFLASRVPLLPVTPPTTNDPSTNQQAQSPLVYSAGLKASPLLNPATYSAAQKSVIHQLLAALKTPQDRTASAAPLNSQALTGAATTPQTPAMGNIPDNIRQLLSNWVSQLPDSQQIGQTATLMQQVRHSGLSYEHQLLAVAEKIRNSLNSSTADNQAGKTAGKPAPATATEGKVNPAPTQQNTAQSADQTKAQTAKQELAGIFRSLWLRTAGASQPSPSVSSEATSKATSPASTAASGAISSAIQNSRAPVSAEQSEPTAEADQRPLLKAAAGLLNPRAGKIQNRPTADIQSQLQLQALKITPADLKAALEQTRTSLESTVPPLQGTADHQIHQLLSTDHKAVLAKALLQWLNQLRPQGTPLLRELPVSQPALQDPPEAFRLLQTALAQTETEQAARLQSPDNNLLNIPLFFRQGEQLREIQLQLRREEQSQSEAGRKKSVRWQLRLHFDLEKLGPMDVDLNMSLPRLSATFWSETQQTLHQLNHQLAPLRQQLQSMGVEVTELQARHGKLPPLARNQVRQYLVDTHG